MVLIFACDLADGDKPVKGSVSSHKKLGSAGLALHYANIITQIDTLVSLSYSAAKLESWVISFSISSSQSIRTFKTSGYIYILPISNMGNLISS